MIFEDWIKQQPDGYYSSPEIFAAGAASRDAEVVSLTNQRDYEYVRAENAEQERDQFEQERDQLRKNVALLRNVLDDKQWEKDGDVHAHNKRVQEALAATEPKP